jgi:glycosyltransferase involved in cell wall biosynthesis
MKIALVSGGWIRVPPQEGGGAEAYIFNLAKQFTRMGQEVTLIDRKHTPNDDAVEHIDGVKIVRLVSAKVNVHNFTVNFVLTQILFGLQVIKWLKSTDYHIIHVYTSILGLVLTMGGKKIKNNLVYGSHGLRRDKASPGLADRIALALENQLVKRAKKTTIANEIIAEKLARQARVKAEKVQVIPIGVDIEQFNPDLDVRNVRQKYGLGGKRNILFVGRICAEKGVEYLVKAADIIVNRLGEDNVQFLIVGPAEQFGTDGKTQSPYKAQIIRLIKDFGLQEAIRLTGIVPVDGLRRLYTACDVVVIPSVVDLDPQVQIEAMASGKPVIGTRVGTMPRRIKDGQSGFVINPADEKQLAEKIQYLLDNPAERGKMGVYARKLVSEQYSSDKMAVRMLEVFEDTNSPTL